MLRDLNAVNPDSTAFWLRVGTGVLCGAIIMLAAIGALVGPGHLDAALILTAVAVPILIGVEAFESPLLRLSRGTVSRQLEDIKLEL
jgi:hypothetical protein